MYGVVSRHRRPGVCAAANLLPPDSVHTITSRRAGYDVWVWVLSYISGLWHIAGKIRWQGWAARNLFTIRHPRAISPLRVNLNAGVKWMLLSPSHALFLLCIYSHFIQRAHNPRGFSIRPGKGERGREGSHRWIWLPSLSSLMPRARKSLCL